jgi:hypothetical protein
MEKPFVDLVVQFVCPLLCCVVIVVQRLVSLRDSIPVVEDVPLSFCVQRR